MKAWNSRWNPKISPIWALILAPIVFFGLKVWFESPDRERYPYHMRIVSSLKRLGLALLLYGEDYDKRLPFVHPFEFGTDPLVEYTKNVKQLHENSTPPNPKKHRPKSTDHRFQYVLNRRALISGVESRLIYDLWNSEEPAEDVIITSPVWSREFFVVTCFADSHVKLFKHEVFVASLPLPGDYPSLFSLKDLLYALPEDKTPPQFWAVPYEAVEMAEKAGGRQK